MRIVAARRWHLVVAAIPLSVSAQTSLDEIEVVASSPLGQIAAADAAGNVQVIDGDALRRQRVLDLTELMNRNIGSVFINEAQSNPLQPDVMYRGFVGSPLLGLPQGIAVYQDGVRINEPFGDTVNWAVVPGGAIDSLQVLPGSDPMFGLNALGGAIAIRTKSGFSHSGTRAEASVGSFGRVDAELETGGTLAESVGYFAAVSYLEEDGWRDFSGSRALQAFTSAGWQSDVTTIEARLSFADTTLTGNGAVPVQLLETDRQAVFTHPDDTDNELAMLNVQASHEVSDALSVSGNAYVRRSDIATLNGDDSDYEACEADASVLCGDGGEPALDLDGQPIAVADALEGATVNRTQTEQDGRGFSLHFEYRGSIAGRNSQLVGGVALDEGDVEFASATELGALDASRGAVGGGVLVGDALTRLSTDARNAGFYVAEHLDFSERLRIGIAGRFNRTDVSLRDRLGTALDGDHDFERFNPSASIVYRLDGARLYLRYSESSRVPSPVELTCADPDDPCRLPNAFLSDPPLEMVIARTWEAGVRGGSNTRRWHVGTFHTVNDDDIIFISAGALTNEGYFDNVGRTRRVGVEANLSGELADSVEWFLNYTYLRATFRDRFTVSSPNNPAAVDGEIAVQPGDRLPLIPEHLLKGGLSWSAGERLRIGLDVQASSDQHLRGDEGNDVAAIPGFAVLNAHGSYALSKSLRIFASVNNLLDREYESFGVFGEPEEVLGDGYDDPRFLSPGAPRGAWIGLELAIE